MREVIVGFVVNHRPHTDRDTHRAPRDELVRLRVVHQSPQLGEEGRHDAPMGVHVPRARISGTWDREQMTGACGVDRHARTHTNTQTHDEGTPDTISGLQDYFIVLEKNFS